MSRALSVYHGHFGRATLYELNRPMTIHAHREGHLIFYLDGATKLLKESLEKLGSDAKVEIFPGKDHGSLMDASLRNRISKEMADAYRAAVGKRKDSN